MPRDGAIIFADLIGKLDMLRVACGKCGRDGCYGLHRLIDRRGRDAKLKWSCLLYPRKRTCAVQLGMSALGQ
jgi:hypothetical protein